MSPPLVVPTLELSRSRVLVTGASGFLGSRLVRRLRALGGEVHAASRSLELGGRDGVIQWRVDLGDPDATLALFQQVRPEIVVQLAGHASAVPGRDQVRPTLQKDFFTAVNVLSAVAGTPVQRLVMTGSLTEPVGDEGVPSSPYAAAKWAACMYGRMFHALYGLPVVIVRPFMGYGPGQAPTKVIPLVIRSLLEGRGPALASGRQEFDWVYVDDLVGGLLAAAAAPDVEGATIDLGTGVLTSIRAVVERLVALIGSDVRPAFGALEDRPLERPRAANTAEALAKLGWRATTPLSEGLERTVASFRSGADQG